MGTGWRKPPPSIACTLQFEVPWVGRPPGRQPSPPLLAPSRPGAASQRAAGRVSSLLAAQVHAGASPSGHALPSRRRRPLPQLSLPPRSRLQADGHGGREEATRISAPLSAAVSEDRERPGGRRPAAAGCRAGCGLGPARRHTSPPTNSSAAAHRGNRERASGWHGSSSSG